MPFRNVGVHSEQTSEQGKFLWRIPNFLEMRNSEEVVNSQSCTFELGQGIGMPTKWKCQLKSQTKDDKKYIGIFAKLTEYPRHMSGVHAHVRFQIQTASNMLDYYLNSVFNENMVESGNGRRWGFPYAIQQEGNDSAVPLTINGCLEILVTVTIFNLHQPDSQILSLLRKYEHRFLETLRSDLASSRDNPTHVTDQVTRIVSKDGHIFSANRVILAARSAVFRSMFQARMKEVETGFVEVEDMAAEPLEVLLDFCHTGTLRETWSKVGVIEGLLYGAGKYMLQDLKEFLGKAVGLVCKKENCGTLMSLARAFGMVEAEASLLEYFKRNMVGSVDQIVGFVEGTVQGLGNSGQVPMEAEVGGGSNHQADGATAKEQVGVAGQMYD